jgi:hypothetical protein
VPQLVSARDLVERFHRMVRDRDPAALPRAPRPSRPRSNRGTRGWAARARTPGRRGRRVSARGNTSRPSQPVRRSNLSWAYCFMTPSSSARFATDAVCM